MSLNPRERTKILGAIRRRVLKNHFNVAGADYNAWAKQIAECTPKLLRCETEEFEAGVRELISQLGSSHTVFYHERTNRLLPQHSINATVRRFSVDGVDRWVFLDVFEGGPADRAGIKPGDVLLAVNDNTIFPPSLPSLELGQTYRLTISSQNDEASRSVSMSIPVRKGTKSRPPIIEPNSPLHRMVAAGIGLLKIPYFPDPTGLGFAKALDAAVRDLKDQGCRGLVIDLRGNIGGSLGFARLASYLCPGKMPIGHSLTPARLRRGYDRDTLPQVPMPSTKLDLMLTLARYAIRDKSVFLLTQGLGQQPFHGKIAILINEWTNSAGEMVASFAAENGLATTIGTATAGNVLGAVNFAVGGGYFVRLPVFGWYTSRGKCLEGCGTQPDIPLPLDLSAVSGSDDPQLRAALQLLGPPDTVRK